MTRVYRISCPAYWLNEPFRLVYVGGIYAFGPYCCHTLHMISFFFFLLSLLCFFNA